MSGENMNEIFSKLSGGNLNYEGIVKTGDKILLLYWDADIDFENLYKTLSGVPEIEVSIGRFKSGEIKSLGFSPDNVKSWKNVEKEDECMGYHVVSIFPKRGFGPI